MHIVFTGEVKAVRAVVILALFTIAVLAVLFLE